MRTRHTGTDCAHMGSSRVAHKGQGICQECTEPMRPRYDGSNKLLEPLDILLVNRELLVQPFPKFTVGFSLTQLKEDHKHTADCIHG